MTDDFDFVTGAPERLAAMTHAVATAITALRDERSDMALERLEGAIVQDGLLLDGAPQLASPEVASATERLLAEVAGVRLDPGWLSLYPDGSWAACFTDTQTPEGYSPTHTVWGRTALGAVERVAGQVRENREWRATHEPYLAIDDA